MLLLLLLLLLIIEQLCRVRLSLSLSTKKAEEEFYTCRPVQTSQ